MRKTAAGVQDAKLTRQAQRRFMTWVTVVMAAVVVVEVVVLVLCC